MKIAENDFACGKQLFAAWKCDRRVLDEAKKHGVFFSFSAHFME